MNPSNFTSQNKLKNDNCYINEQIKGNKSIFDYVTDTSMFINKANCFDSTPPFIGYIPIGVQSQNVDIENELRGATRPNTKCTTCKYQSQQPNLASNGLNNQIMYNKHQCEASNQILPNGYMHMPRK
jgi:hypothetical protein